MDVQAASEDAYIHGLYDDVLDGLRQPQRFVEGVQNSHSHKP
jgi:hypothetical protein